MRQSKRQTQTIRNLSFLFYNICGEEGRAPTNKMVDGPCPEFGEYSSCQYNEDTSEHECQCDPGYDSSLQPDGYVCMSLGA